MHVVTSHFEQQFFEMFSLIQASYDQKYVLISEAYIPYVRLLPGHHLGSLHRLGLFYNPHCLIGRLELLHIQPGVREGDSDNTLCIA